MPSGYTDSIYRGEETTFPQFASLCARAFGALVTLRDEPMSNELPDSLEASSYYAESLQKHEAELAKLKSLTPKQAELRADRDYIKSQEYHRGQIDKARAMRLRYVDMLEKVSAWEPPSSEHTGLKEFMISQLTDSMKMDCNTNYHKRALDEPKQSGKEWLASQIERKEREIENARKSYAEEIERTTARNLWISQLRESLEEQTQSNKTEI